jgi:hypothetical protein
MEALTELSNASSSAQKYGPFFFALFLLLLTPAAVSFLMGRAVRDVGDDSIKSLVITTYLNYFRICVYVGSGCTATGVGWWLFENYRQYDALNKTLASLKWELETMKRISETMRYTAVGYIQQTGNMADNDFVNTLGRETIVYSHPVNGKTWIFAVISDHPIDPKEPVPVIMTITVPATKERVTWNLELPIQASPKPLHYNLVIDDGGARIVLQQ